MSALHKAVHLKWCSNSCSVTQTLGTQFHRRFFPVRVTANVSVQSWVQTWARLWHRVSVSCRSMYGRGANWASPVCWEPFGQVAATSVRHRAPLRSEMEKKPEHIYSRPTLVRHKGKGRIYVRGTHNQQFQTAAVEPLWCNKKADLHEGCSKASFSNTLCRAALVPQRGESMRWARKGSIFTHLLQSRSGAQKGGST